MMQIKAMPEDFIVEEMNTLHFDNKGAYSYYKLKKINTDHNTALQTIANALNINRKYINAAGVKDKHAITTQYLSISQGPKKDFKTENIELTFLGNGKERINIGQLEGNTFAITVRNITEEEIKIFEKNIKKQKEHLCIPNYYDDQRFGMHKDNAMIGKLFLKRQWKEACTILKEREKKVKEFLQTKPTDYIGALRTILKQQLRMYVHAYQSYLWNETVKEFINENIKEKKKTKNEKRRNEHIPIIGFEIDCKNKKITQIIKNIMKEEGIKERDFIIREIPELSSSGGQRELFMGISDFSYNKINDETMLMRFTLKKGSYATIVIKSLFAG